MWKGGKEMRETEGMRVIQCSTFYKYYRKLVVIISSKPLLHPFHPLLIYLFIYFFSYCIHLSLLTIFYHLSLPPFYSYCFSLHPLCLCTSSAQKAGWSEMKQRYSLKCVTTLVICFVLNNSLRSKKALFTN